MEAQREHKIKYITVIITENCNLSCSYCYEHHKTDKILNPNLAIDIITRELTANDGYDEVSIDFFGGEPFLEFDNIKSIVEHFKAKKFSKPFSFFASTNGTNFTEQIKEWIINNNNIFNLALSLDGTKEMQDINRSSSFDLIDLDFFTKRIRNAGLKMTISQETIGKLAEGVLYCHSLGFKRVLCNLACGVDWSKRDNVSILDIELNKLIDFYLEHPEITPCDLLKYDIANVAYTNNGQINKYCGAGTRMKVFDTDGREYPCQYFLPMSVGEESKNFANQRFTECFNIREFDPKCQLCVAVEICPSCYGSNFVQTGNMHGRDENFCELTKIIVRANSFFKARQWELGLLKLDEEQEQALLQGIMKIQKNLS